MLFQFNEIMGLLRNPARFNFVFCLEIFISRRGFMKTGLESRREIVNMGLCKSKGARK